MSLKKQLLELLDGSRGEYISGQELADAVNVTRSAVWKAIKALKAEGLCIKSSTNKGYCLSEDEDILSETAVQAYLSKAASDLRIEVADCLPSTNSAVRALAVGGEREGKVIIACSQTEGRGRLDRRFFSPGTTGLYMSILLRPSIPAADSALITTAAAVSAARAIERLSRKTAQIKWVNDVFLDGKKVCGILTEAGISLESSTLDYAVLGIGINLLPPAGGFPQELSSVATSVFDDRKPRGNIRGRLAAEVLNNFMEYYKELCERTFLPEYKKRLFVLGKRVTVLRGEEQREAVPLDINEHCHLLVRYDDGTEEYLTGGEISIRPCEI